MRERVTLKDCVRKDSQRIINSLRLDGAPHFRLDAVKYSIVFSQTGDVIYVHGSLTELPTQR